MVLNDREISRLVNEQGMIEPFVGEGVSHLGTRKVISFGLSSFGYDARLAYYFKIFTPINPAGPTCVDPKAFTESVYQGFEVKEISADEGSPLVMPPHSFLLGSTIERFRIPRNVICICVGKSTYARCGIIVNVTPLEPEWKGYVTIEISNTSPLPARIYAGEGICQFLFMEGASCDRSYADKNGKYQNQLGLTDPKA